MNQPDYSHDLPAGYRSWTDFDTDIEQHIARPDQVHDVYYYLSREGANVITMGELPDHQQLRYERVYVRRMARKESKPASMPTQHPTPSEDLPPAVKTWTELLASLNRRFQHSGWVDAYITDTRDPASFTHYYLRHQIMQHVAEEQKAAEVEPFNMDELRYLHRLVDTDFSRVYTDFDQRIISKLAKHIQNIHEAERIERRYPQQIIDGE